MKHSLTLLMALFLLVMGTTAFGQTDSQEPAPRTFEYEEGDTVYVMKRYVLVLLKRGDQAHDFSEEELKELQAGHMANMAKLEADGYLAMAGPMDADEDLRGIFVFDVGTLAEAEALVATDPAIQAGRLKAELHLWWAAQGTTLP